MAIRIEISLGIIIYQCRKVTDYKIICILLYLMAMFYRIYFKCEVNGTFYSQEFDWHEVHLSFTALLTQSRRRHIFQMRFPLSTFSGAIQLYKSLFWIWILLISGWPMTASQTTKPILSSRNNFYLIRQVHSYDAALQKI